ncbi:transglutaminase-like putative cysteine protease [Pacificibacter maritimus]|uniref:Transglutaminase-like putative cysteine protease n=1 Tax=Pacificibacter maritimus TaxID=762213 RepID=A0A3N4UPW9_9RHOB|nr:transglutaminase family protein [Pacificibacter maritimus]RPE72098.1 transglutaminase-like putative cysteine protease [Pacificibacter maritimus]
MKLSIRHTTRYLFETPVQYGLQQVRLTPKTTAVQHILNWSIQVVGGAKEVAYDDQFNNHVDLISFDRGATEVTLISEGEVEVTETHGVIGAHRGPAPLWLFDCPTDLTKSGKGVKALVKKVKGDTDLDRLHNLSALIHKAVAYQVGSSQSDWTAEDSLKAKTGVCQDHAHIFVTCAREMGIPARYVSGYLMMDDRIAQDATHAWAEAFVTGLGWIGFDVSNAISPDVRYVRIATGLDYADAAPVTGTRYGGSGETLSVQIEVAQQ